eukprot:jgi/Mesvir1/29433/Mv23015-RA.1
MAAPRESSAGQVVYQLKISLEGCKPRIWRRIQVLDTTTLEELHEVIQRVMGWQNDHLHLFTIEGTSYGEPSPDAFDEFDDENEADVKLSDVFKGENFKFLYNYDFGDNWDHQILVEKILPRDSNQRYPVCLTGKRACPREDCGGVCGYAVLLAALHNPHPERHPEYRDMLKWITEVFGGRFDPDKFDLEDVNARLSEIR